MHDTVLSGHLGYKKTFEKIFQRFYWFGMREDVRIYIASCEVCGANSLPNHHPKAPLGDMRVGAPLDRLSTDVLGPLPLTQRGNRYILVVTDHFSKWVELTATPDQTAQTCARIILNEVIARFGCPLSLHSDQGRNYESSLFAELCNLLEIRKTRTSPRNPKCNGQAERFNKTMIRMIRAYLKGEQRNWDLNLGCLAAAYRATPNDSTGFTPNLVMLGREVRLPYEVTVGGGIDTIDSEIKSYGDYVSKIKERLETAHDIVRKNLKKSVERRKDYYDSKQKSHNYEVGSLAWFRNEARFEDVCPKLQPPYLGPVLVLQKLGPVNYVIQLKKDSKPRTVHHDKLKPYHGSVVLPWSKRALKEYKPVQF